MILQTLKYTSDHTQIGNSLTPTKLFYSSDSHTPERHIELDSPSRLDKSLLFDSGLSVFELKYLTFVTTANFVS